MEAQPLTFSLSHFLSQILSSSSSPPSSTLDSSATTKNSLHPSSIEIRVMDLPPPIPTKHAQSAGSPLTPLSLPLEPFLPLHPSPNETRSRGEKSRRPQHHHEGCLRKIFPLFQPSSSFPCLLLLSFSPFPYSLSFPSLSMASKEFQSCL